MNEQQRGELSRIVTSIHNESVLLQALARQLRQESIDHADADQQVILANEVCKLAAAAVKIRQYIRMIEQI